MEEKTMELLEKATNVFMRYGIKSITMDDIASNLYMPTANLTTINQKLYNCFLQHAIKSGLHRNRY